MRLIFVGSDGRIQPIPHFLLLSFILNLAIFSASASPANDPAAGDAGFAMTEVLHRRMIFL
jgi:hypothetical protein